jgi:hypothetical protein
LYHRLGEAAFFDLDISSSSLFTKVINCLKETIVKNVFLNSDELTLTQNKSYIEKYLDWESFYQYYDYPHNSFNEIQEIVLIGNNENIKLNENEKKAMNNPLLKILAMLFIDRHGEKNSNWIKAINYFIWLGYLHHKFSINSYYVLHSQNLKTLCESFVGKTSIDYLKSGICIWSNKRLPEILRENCKLMFKSILNPLEEILNAKTVLDAGEQKGITVGDKAILEFLGHTKHDAGNIISGLLNPDKDVDIMIRLMYLLWTSIVASESLTEKKINKKEILSNNEGKLWHLAGYDGESISTTLEKAFSAKCALTVNEFPDRTLLINPIVYGLVIEIVRNLYKHTEKGFASFWITKEKNKKGNVGFRINTRSEPNDPDKDLGKINHWINVIKNEGSCKRGIYIICNMLKFLTIPGESINLSELWWIEENGRNGELCFQSPLLNFKVKVPLEEKND